MTEAIAITKEQEESYSREQLEFLNEYELSLNAQERGKHLTALEATVEYDPDSQVLLGKYYVIVDPKYGMINRGRQYLEKAVKNGKAEACYLLGKIYEDYDKPENYSLAEWSKKRIRLKDSLKIYEQGAKGGCLECQKVASFTQQKLANHEATGDSCLVQSIKLVLSIIGIISMGSVGVAILGVAESINTITIPAIVIIVIGSFLFKKFRR